MLQSTLFSKTRREAPKDEVSKNAQLLIRAGFIHKELAGVYSYLPLGLRSLKKIEQIIREEMESIGGQEVLLSSLQDSEKWQKSGRWSKEANDIWFKTELASGSEVGLANTHEEAMAVMMTDHVRSYHDLPRYVYQFQNKFRNELRAKSGIMRTREFIMKDLYSFAKSEEELDQYYEQVTAAYKKIFQRVGIGDRTFLTFASGGMFSKFSHEFQTICEAGEDTIYVSTEHNMAVNLEVCNDEVLGELQLIKDDLVPHKAIEVGNIFKLGTRYSEPLGLTYTDEGGKKQPVIMGSYGIGLGRLLGTIAEVLSDDKGLVWPKAVAPFAVHLVALQGKDGKVLEAAQALYQKLQKAGVETLLDDRNLKAGEHFADADLLGLPTRVVLSEKTLAAGTYEVRDRRTGETQMLDEAKLLQVLAA